MVLFFMSIKKICKILFQNGGVLGTVSKINHEIRIWIHVIELDRYTLGWVRIVKKIYFRHKTNTHVGITQFTVFSNTS